MKFEVILKGDYKSVSDRLTQMSLNKSQVFLPGFSLNSDWEINRNSNYFEVSKPYKLFDFLGKSQSNYIAKIDIEDSYANVEIKLKTYSVFVLITAVIFVAFFLLSAILNGTILGFITILFPFLYAYAIILERKAFIISVNQLLNDEE
ncbi:MAG: hypothetical protein FGM41_04230 [Bacteroidetes bacterium]|nr:hypothetical protein [Bacteroidota bacterium]